MAKVDVVADDTCTAIFPRQFPAVLRVRTRDGGQLVEEVLTNRGGPERPLSYQELTTKFRDNAGRLLDAEVVEGIHRTVARLDTLDAVGELTGRLASAAANPDH